MTGGAFLLILALFAAVCLWQLLTGLKKMRMAKDNPSHPNAAVYARVGKIQAIAGAAILAVNILLSWQAVRALL